MKIIIIGAGSFGTSLASALCINPANEIILWTHIPEEAEEMKATRVNKKYFPGRILDTRITISSERDDLMCGQIVFLAIPSGVIVDFIKAKLEYFSADTLFVNLSKGLYENGQTIPEALSQITKNSVVSLKGPSFAGEVMNNAPTIFTLGFKKRYQAEIIAKIFENTNLFLDYTTDIRGVELLSVIKNIYAIFLGIVDARYNSPNTRFMMLTKAYNEMRLLLEIMGGKKDTIFLSCGYGDLGLTALNDLSRNRTLGLLIGKGFFTQNNTTNSIVLEGVKSINTIYHSLSTDQKQYTPLLNALFDYFQLKSPSDFEMNFHELINVKMKTVLTYGKFDLLHYGHVEILRRARKMGDRLIVGLSTDEYNEVQNKSCVLSYEKRKEMLEALEYVDEVIPEKNREQKIKDIKEHAVDIFVMGDDCTGKYDFLSEYCEICYLPRTDNILRTTLKSLL